MVERSFDQDGCGQLMASMARKGVRDGTHVSLREPFESDDKKRGTGRDEIFDHGQVAGMDVCPSSCAEKAARWPGRHELELKHLETDIPKAARILCCVRIMTL
jgi:hypothetical protein